MRGCCLSGNFAMKVVKETGRDVPVFLEGSVAIVVTTCVTRLGSTCARLINIYVLFYAPTPDGRRLPSPDNCRFPPQELYC